MFHLEKQMPFGLNRRNWPWFLLGFAALLALASLGDAIASRSFQSWPQPLTGFFAAITDIGLSEWMLVPALVLFAVCAGLALVIPKRIPKLALIEMAQLYGFIFVGVGLPGLISNLIKRGIGRGRPLLYDSVGDFDFHTFANDWRYESWPSGHATNIFAFALVVGFLSPRWYPAMLVLGVLVGLSRVVVGAHYPTDVLAGAVLGTLVAYLVRNVFASRRWVFRRRSDGTIRRRGFAAVRRLARSKPKVQRPAL